MLTFLNCDAQYWWTKHICQWNCQHSTWIGHIPVFLHQNLIKKHLHFQKTILWEEITLMWIEQIPITPSKYVHARLKCCDDRFAANPQYIFHALEIVLKEMLLQAWFILLKGKEIESEINVCQLINYVDIRRIIWDNQISFSFKNIRGTLQYFHNMLLDVLAKFRQFGGRGGGGYTLSF